VFVGCVSTNRTNQGVYLADYASFINALYKFSKSKKFETLKDEGRDSGVRSESPRHVAGLPECTNFTIMVQEYLVDENDEASIIKLDLTLRKSVERASFISSGSNKIKPLPHLSNTDPRDEYTEWCREY